MRLQIRIIHDDNEGGGGDQAETTTTAAAYVCDAAIITPLLERLADELIQQLDRWPAPLALAAKTLARQWLYEQERKYQSKAFRPEKGEHPVRRVMTVLSTILRHVNHEYGVEIHATAAAAAAPGTPAIINHFHIIGGAMAAGRDLGKRQDLAGAATDHQTEPALS
ncbi:MAG: hypothetical protein IRY83_15265 [Chloroflexi bacterium]|nr:hypothetical protein [Chloroflexota bacterium]